VSAGLAERPERAPLQRRVSEAFDGADPMPHENILGTECRKSRVPGPGCDGASNVRRASLRRARHRTQDIADLVPIPDLHPSSAPCPIQNHRGACREQADYVRLRMRFGVETRLPRDHQWRPARQPSSTRWRIDRHGLNRRSLCPCVQRHRGCNAERDYREHPRCSDQGRLPN
jgi:hypothetical protein